MQIRNYRCVSRVESRPAAEGKVNGNREFGRKLAELRKACKLNQTEVAQKSALNVQLYLIGIQ